MKGVKLTRWGWLIKGRGSGWGHWNPKTQWSKYVKNRVAINTLCLFNACLFNIVK
jgi:hypothetical protein